MFVGGYTVFMLSERRIIDRISSHFANTFISLWPILLIEIKGFGPTLSELFPFVILNGFCLEPFVFLYLEESFIEFHHILQTDS